MNSPILHWVDNTADLYDFLANVIVCAPDDFIEEDFLPPDQQLNLERAFLELERGMQFLAEDGVEPERMSELRRLLDASLTAYRTGNDVKGAHLLHDFESVAFKDLKSPSVQSTTAPPGT
jgi:hypothetical protein